MQYSSALKIRCLASSSLSSRRGLLNKMFRGSKSTHLLTTRPSWCLTLVRVIPVPTNEDSSKELTTNSDNMLVSRPNQGTLKVTKDEERDPDAVVSALSSTYGGGRAALPFLRRYDH